MDRSNLYKNLPDSPGVYFMKDGAGNVIYIGKASNLKRRVSSYFSRAHDLRIEKLVKEIAKIDHERTDTALEALILESRLIKQIRPKFNVKEKDDKSFLYVEITKEKFPRVLLTRAKDMKDGRLALSRGEGFGPFTSAQSIREALKILRRIFPWSTHVVSSIRYQVSGNIKSRPCFDYEIGLCPGTCIGAVSRKDYLKNISRLKLFFEGKKIKILKSLQKDMESMSKNLEFEKAVKVRRQIFSLQHIRDMAMIAEEEVVDVDSRAATTRIEGYDISNISGTSAVGSMVVFSAKGGSASGGENFQPDKNEYRKFKIRTLVKSDDVGMIKEVLSRRVSHGSDPGGWPLPDLILIDGGLGQVSAARTVLRAAGLKIPILGIAKGPERKRNDFIGDVPGWVRKIDLIRVRNEAHRFAIQYHRKLRSQRFLN